MADVGQVTLARACVECIRVKRKCTRTLPRCERCTKQNLACNYTNEPLAQAGSALVQAPQQSTPQRSQNTPIFPTWLTGLRGYQITFPDIVMAMNQSAVDYLLTNLKTFPARFVQKGCTPFIHHKQYPDGLPPLLDNLFALSNIHTTQTENLEAVTQEITRVSYQLVQSIPSLFHPFEDKLAFVQSLVLLQIITLFSPTTTSLHRQEAEARIPLLRTWITRLYEAVPATLPNSMAPYRAWLMAESCRRTMHVAHMILGLHSMLTQGSFTLTLFVEALPLDRNTLKWDYGDHACERRRALSGEAENCPTNLISYRELADMWCKGEVKQTTLLEEMLLVACKGVEIVLPRLGTEVESEASRERAQDAQDAAEYGYPVISCA